MKLYALAYTTLITETTKSTSMVSMSPYRPSVQTASCYTMGNHLLLIVCPYPVQHVDLTGTNRWNHRDIAVHALDKTPRNILAGEIFDTQTISILI